MFLYFGQPAAPISCQHKKNEASKRKARCSAPGSWAVSLTSSKTLLLHVFCHLAQPNCTFLPHRPIFSPSLIYRSTLLFAFHFCSFSPEPFKDLNLWIVLQWSAVIEGRVNSIHHTAPLELIGCIHNSWFNLSSSQDGIFTHCSYSQSIHLRSQPSLRWNFTRVSLNISSALTITNKVISK